MRVAMQSEMEMHPLLATAMGEVDGDDDDIITCVCMARRLYPTRREREGGNAMYNVDVDQTMS